MIISPEPADDFVSLQHPPLSGGKTERDESRVVAQYEGYGVEDVGLLKMDLLGLRNLSIIKQTIKIINKKARVEGKTVLPMFAEFEQTLLFHPPLDDTLTYTKIFSMGDTGGVFQFESDGMKTWLKKLRPNVFDDLIAMVALYRP
jgi:DNA polymerase-3 subunit alpha